MVETKQQFSPNFFIFFQDTVQINNENVKKSNKIERLKPPRKCHTVSKYGPDYSGLARSIQELISVRWRMSIRRKCPILKVTSGTEMEWGTLR